MMTRLVPPERLGWLSGTGWAIGYLGGLISLGLTLALLAADPSTGKTLAGLSPIFGLDAATREGDRFSGPLTALWFIVFVAPMFLFTPDTVRSGLSLRAAAQGGVGRLMATLRELPRLPSLGRFLLANMIYQDALVALFAFGGIYAAGVFGWQTIEIGIFGILLTVTGTLGAWLGGRVDDAIGGKAVVLGAIACLLLAPWLVLPTVCLLGAGIGAIFPLSLIVTLDHASDPEGAGDLMAFVQGGGYVMASVMPFFAGWVRDASSDLSAAWLLMAAGVAAMLAMATRFSPGARV
jgi:MFS-type transporter involved in bile tolerance (Atg22 family)